VQNYLDAQIYAAGDIKACFVLHYTITNLIAGFKFPYNRKALIYFVMEHRNMSIIESDDVQNFCKCLVTSTIGEFMTNFRGRFGPIIKSGCKWEIQKFKSMKKNIVSPSTPVRLLSLSSKPPCENLQYNAALPFQSNPAAYNAMVARYVQDFPNFPPVPWLQNLHSSSSSTLSTITPTTVVPSHHQNNTENPVSPLVTAVIVTPSTSETTASSVGSNPASRKIVHLSQQDFAMQLEIESHHKDAEACESSTQQTCTTFQQTKKEDNLLQTQQVEDYRKKQREALEAPPSVATTVVALAAIEVAPNANEVEIIAKQDAEKAEEAAKTLAAEKVEKARKIAADKKAKADDDAANKK
jgi:hypothetical protein